MTFPFRRPPEADLVASLHAIGDGLRSGTSLRQSLIQAAGTPGSPLAPVRSALAAGRPLVGALRDTAASGDADLSSALCVLAVHAEAGGDPLPAVRMLAQRLARRRAARDEARALSTQARAGARTILFLTPLFLLLLGVNDARGLLGWVTQPRTRTAVIGGLMLQGVGALWIGSIVGGVGGVGGDRSRLSRVPVLRAARALIAGRQRPMIDMEVADAAETMAIVLDAGLSASRAIAATAPYTGGSFGPMLRATVADIGSPPHAALMREADAASSEAVRRFADAVRTSVLLGVPLAPALRWLADDLRERAALDLTEDARRASVRVLIPLGVVVLPAFVLACLVPMFVNGVQGITG